MTNLQESARLLNEAFKTEREKNLEAKIKQLEEIIENLAQRVEYLESQLYL